MKLVTRSLFSRAGVDPGFAGCLGDVFTEAGLRNVGVKKVRYPVGKKLGNETDSRNLIEAFKLTVPTIVGAALGKLIFLEALSMYGFGQGLTKFRNGC